MAFVASLWACGPQPISPPPVLEGQSTANRLIDVAAPAVSYARTDTSYAGWFVERTPTPRLVFLFADPPERHRERVAELLPANAPFELRDVEYTLAELDAAKARVGAAWAELHDAGIDVLSSGIDIAANRVAIGIVNLTEGQAAAIRARFGPVVEPFGDPWASVPSSTPTPAGVHRLRPGTDYRILLDRPMIAPEGIEVAADSDALSRAWEALNVGVAVPDVPFEDEVVVFLHALVSATCPELVLAAIEVDDTGQLAYGVYRNPAPRGECGDTGGSHTFVVAVRRGAIPPSVTTFRIARDLIGSTESHERQQVSLLP